MKLAQSIAALSAITAAAMAPGAWAANDEQHDSHHSAAAAVVQGPATRSAQPMPGMAGMKDQMKAMHEMHGKMMAAATPEERNALMAEHRKIMQESMATMNRMGGGEPSGVQGDMAARQGMMEQRMDMMQSMMQMMMDRMAPAPNPAATPTPTPAAK